MRTEDGYVITKCLNGEPEAFGFLMDKYKGSVYAFAYSRLRNFHDAEDVTQEVFIKAYRKLRSLRRWDNFLAWLYAITSNMCKNWIRFKASRPDSEFVEDQNAEILMQPSLSSYREDRIDETLREALDSLPETQRQVLTLHYLGGMSGKEIARFLGISPGAVWERLSRARAQLREEMLGMMSTTFETQKLQAGFTMRMVEIVKRIKIHPIPRTAGLPWGMSLAAGIIIAILSVGTHLNLTNTEPHASISSLSGESMVQEVGEFPVDVMKMSDMTITSDQHLPGNGLGNVAPDIENALFMAPQAEGGTWTKKADMPAAKYVLSASVSGGKIYTIGGHDNNANPVSTTEEYDPAADKWIEKTSMPTARANLSTSTVNGKIYAIGGYLRGQPREFSIVEEYDPVNDKWTKKTNMPTERQLFSTSVVDGKIYAIGGWRVGNALATTEEYDPVNDKWTKKANMPATRYGCSAETVNGKIYVIGGCPIGKIGDQFYGNGGFLSTVEEYDPVLDKWTRKADMPTARMGLVTAVVGGKIYAIGGTASKDLFPTMPVVEEYDPLTDNWARKSDMPTPRCWMSVGAANGKIYVIGGRNGIAVSAVEEYDPVAESESINFKGKLPTIWGEVRTASSK